jgi:hypothetical protein
VPYGTDGRQFARITGGDFDVIQVEAADDKNGWLYFSASPDHPTQHYLYRTPLRGGTVERLSSPEQPGWHTYDFSPDAQWAMHTYSTFTNPPVVELVRLPEHQVVRRLADNLELSISNPGPADRGSAGVSEVASVSARCNKARTDESSKTSMNYYLTSACLAAAALLALPADVFAAKATHPNCTKGESIPEGFKHDWNLGATGARGWRWRRVRTMCSFSVQPISLRKACSRWRRDRAGRAVRRSNAGDAWTSLYRGDPWAQGQADSPGYQQFVKTTDLRNPVNPKTSAFPAVTASKVRLYIAAASARPQISEFEVYSGNGPNLVVSAGGASVLTSADRNRSQPSEAASARQESRVHLGGRFRDQLSRPRSC